LRGIGEVAGAVMAVNTCQSLPVDSSVMVPESEIDPEPSLWQNFVAVATLL